MLIPSPRHTAADLALWREHEAADLIHGERFERSGKPEQAIEHLRTFAKSRPSWIGTSWGKDSVVLMHLAVRSGLSLPCYHFRVPGHEPPETDAVRDAWLARFPTDYHHVETPRPTPLAGGGYDLKESKVAGVLSAVPAERRAGWINGMRGNESAVRRIYMRKFGPAGCAASCSPLGWWTVADIFGYLAHHHLPVHPAYAFLGGGRWPRQHLRVSPLGGVMGDSFGRGEHDAEYYGDILRRL